MRTRDKHIVALVLELDMGKIQRFYVKMPQHFIFENQIFHYIEVHLFCLRLYFNDFLLDAYAVGCQP